MAEVMVRWRDDASPEFYSERLQEIDKVLDFLYFSVPGEYRARQYEISFTDDLPFALIAVEEQVEVLDV